MIGYNGSISLRNDGVDPSTSNKDLNAAIGALITVRVASVPAGQGTLASLFDINNSAIANPVTSDDFGNYFFKIATGNYDIIIQEGTPNEVVEPAQAIGQTAELISDLSQAYEFDDESSVAASNIILPLKKTVITKGKASIGDGLGAVFLVAATSSTVHDIGLFDGKFAVFQNSVGLNEFNILSNQASITV